MGDARRPRRKYKGHRERERKREREMEKEWPIEGVSVDAKRVELNRFTTGPLFLIRSPRSFLFGLFVGVLFL